MPVVGVRCKDGMLWVVRISLGLVVINLYRSGMVGRQAVIGIHRRCENPPGVCQCCCCCVLLAAGYPRGYVVLRTGRGREILCPGYYTVEDKEMVVRG